MSKHRKLIEGLEGYIMEAKDNHDFPLFCLLRDCKSQLEADEGALEICREEGYRVAVINMGKNAPINDAAKRIMETAKQTLGEQHDNKLKRLRG